MPIDDTEQFTVNVGLSSLTTYSFYPISDIRFCPLGMVANDTTHTYSPLPSNYITDQIVITSCPGEYIAATFIIKPDIDMTSFLPVPSNLSDGQGHSIASSNTDIKGVKCWYQRGRDTYPASQSTRLLVPELLLNDDDLVHVAFTSDTVGTNSIRVGSTWVLDTNLPTTSTQVNDSATLLPLSIPANTYKQYWITQFIPIGTPAGTYTGQIMLNENGETVSSMNIIVEVLPFTLPLLNSGLNPKITSIYYSEPTVTSAPRLDSYNGRSATQFQAEFNTMKKHGVLNPHVNVPYSNSTFNQYMLLRAQAGLSFDPFFYHAEYLKNLTTSQVTALVTNVKNWFINTGQYPPYNIPVPSLIYFYIVDEIDAVPYSAQAEACRNAPPSSIVSKTFAALGGSSSCTYIYNNLNHNPPPVDLSNNCYNPWKYACLTQAITDYHEAGLKVGNYGAPQCGEEKPHTYRQNFGIVQWKYGFDVSDDYAFADGASGHSLWDDWAGPSPNYYKTQGMCYPTSTGNIDTIEWEGFREGVNDLRYIKKLEEIADAQATTYLNTVKAMNMTQNNLDLDSIRNNIIDHICRILGTC